MKGEGKSLKSGNQPKLITFVVANVVVFGVALVGLARMAELVRAVEQGEYVILARAIAIPALGGLVLGAIGWIIPKSWKEALVFWHVGVRRLPSSEAFTKIAPADLRIDMETLSARLGPLPTDFQKQSALWYAVYRKHLNEAAVTDANSAFLLYREMSALTPILLVALLAAGVVAGASTGTIAVASLGVLIEYLLLMVAARHAGARLVANVLAIEAAGPTQAPQPAASVTRPRKAAEPKIKKAPET
jgi:hypothetical protein